MKPTQTMHFFQGNPANSENTIIYLFDPPPPKKKGPIYWSLYFTAIVGDTHNWWQIFSYTWSHHPPHFEQAGPNLSWQGSHGSRRPATRGERYVTIVGQKIFTQELPQCFRDFQRPNGSQGGFLSLEKFPSVFCLVSLHGRKPKGQL